MKNSLRLKILAGLGLSAMLIVYCVFAPRPASLAVPAPVASNPAVAPAVEMIAHGRFKAVSLYRPAGPVQQVVLFLSGDAGWDAEMDLLAKRLRDQGALVAGIDNAQLVEALEADDGDCTYPDGDLENLSHYLQGYAKLPGYFTPLLVGYSSGATMVYALLAQAPAKTFAGAISMGFCPDLEMKKALCKGENLQQRRRKDGGMDLLPTTLPAPWVVLHGETDTVCAAASAKAFVDQLPASRWLPLAGVGHDYADAPTAVAAFESAYRDLATATLQAVASAPKSLADLPLVEVPAMGTGAGDTFAVLLSGDGGWAGLDTDVARALAAQGIPVVGLDSLRYFWTVRTPAGLAGDLDRVLAYYATTWARPQAILIGYSQGADVLPFAVNRLSAKSKALVTRTALLGLGEKASFEFHLDNWAGGDDDGALPILPEVSRMEAKDTLCVYGEDDDESICLKIPLGHVQLKAMPGGHHFDGAYDELAKVILTGVAPR